MASLLGSFFCMESETQRLKIFLFLVTRLPWVAVRAWAEKHLVRFVMLQGEARRFEQSDPILRLHLAGPLSLLAQRESCSWIPSKRKLRQSNMQFEITVSS